MEQKSLIIDLLGDSITEGAGASSPDKSYPALLGELAKAKINNYGVSGTRIARQRVLDQAGDPDEDFILRARWMEKTADFLFVYGGTNDFGHGDAPLGKLGDMTPFTFYGAMAMLCEDLTNRYGFKKDRICFILPTHRFDEDGGRGDGSKAAYLQNHRLCDYVKAETEVLKNYGIEAIALETLSQKPASGQSEYSIDGIHPNDKGHRLIAKELYDYLRAKGLCE